MTQNNGDQALVMVVDDNPEFLAGIEMTLSMEGFQVWKAKNGQHALDELQAAFTGQSTENPQINRLPDLILADIMMPVMDGYDFYERVQGSPYLNHIPFIFLTAKAEGTDIRRGKELGVDDYLPKFSEPEDILASVRGKLNRIERRWTIAALYSDGDSGEGEGRMAIMITAIVALVVLVAFFSWVILLIVT